MAHTTLDILIILISALTSITEGGGEYTRKRMPVELVFTEEFMNRDDAFDMERKIKGWSRRKKEALIRGDWESLRMHAKKKFKKKSR